MDARKNMSSSYEDEGSFPYEEGNIDLYSRPIVKNEDGSISTVKTKSFNFDGQETVLPTISDDGREMSEEETIAQYLETGKHLGKFRSIEEATAFAEQLHEEQEAYYNAVLSPDQSVPYINPKQHAQAIRMRREHTQEETAPLYDYYNKEREEFGVLYSAWRENLAAHAWVHFKRALIPADDIDWDKRGAYETLRVGLPERQWEYLLSADSEQEMALIRDELDKNNIATGVLSRAGVGGVFAQLAVGMFDLDTLLFVGKVGKSVNTALKMGGTSTTVRQAVMSGAKAGAFAGGVYGVGRSQLAIDGGSEDIVTGLIAGGAFGAGLGAIGGTANKMLLERRLNKSVNDTAKSFMEKQEQLVKQDQMNRYGTAKEKTDSAPLSEVGESPEFFGNDISYVKENAGSRAKAIRASMKDNIVSRGAQTLLDKSPVTSDIDAILNLKSDTAVNLAYDLLEHPSGKIRQNKTSAIMNESFRSRILTPVMDVYDGLYTKYAKEVLGTKMLDRVMKAASKIKFNREVLLELNDRYHGRSSGNNNKYVEAMADAIDAGAEEALRIGKGLEGEIPVRGFEGLDPRAGYFPTRYSFDNLHAAITTHGEDAVVNMLAKGYQSGMPDAPRETTVYLAKALIRRAKANLDGLDTRVGNQFHLDQKDFMVQLLRDNDTPENAIKQFVKHAYPDIEDMGRAGYTYRRNPLDISVASDEVDGLTILDLMDNDLVKVWSSYSRDLAGRSALARKGLESASKRKQVIDTIIEELRVAKAKGEDVGDLNKIRKHLEDVFSYFTAGPIAGGVSNTVRRIKQTTQLSLLSQLGLPQLAETGAIIATVGVRRFFKHAKLAAQMLKDGKIHGKSDLAEELKFTMGSLWNEHLLFRDNLAMDYSRGSSGNSNKFFEVLDSALSKGMVAQGYLSGFYNIRQLQSRIAVSSIADKVLSAIKTGDKKYLSRLSDIGIDERLAKRIREKYIDTGKVEFGDKGYVEKGNFHQWGLHDIQEFSLALHRHSNQVLQKAMAGESTIWMHKNVGSLFTQLQHFPLTAMHKQFLRNVRLADEASMMTFLYGMGTASIAYTARQIINGRDENLNLSAIAQGTFSLNNMTGWVPMMTNPPLAALGLSDFSIGYGPRNASGLFIPPSLSVAQRLAGLPKGIVNVARGEASSADINAIKALPIVGNAYGASRMWEALKDDD